MQNINKKFVGDLDLRGKRVLVRLDLNVPFDKKTGKITSIKRIEEALPTINHIVENGGKAILMSHLGRVKTKEDRDSKSLLPVAEALSNLLDKDIKFVDKTRGSRLEKAIEKMKDGEILMMENTRFEDLNEKAESKNDPELGAYWASLGDVFVNDAFGTAHRAHASNVGIASNINESAIGFLIRKEIASLDRVLHQPAKPFVAIIGGAKVSDKIQVLDTLIQNVDTLVIGGAMAYTFLKAQGIGTGDSLVEDEFVEYAAQFLEAHRDKVVLPVDHALSKKFENSQPVYNFDNPLEIPRNFQALDIGPESAKLIRSYLRGDAFTNTAGAAKTVFWNGPMGVTEFSNFARGTQEVVEGIAELTGAFSVVGGGDSVAAIENLDAAQFFSHISTGGGASVEFIEGKELPGIAAIQDDIYDSNFVSPSARGVETEYDQVLDSAVALDNYTNEISYIDDNGAVLDDSVFDSMLLDDVILDDVASDVVVEENRDFADLSTAELEQSLLEDLGVVESEPVVEEVVEEVVFEESAPLEENKRVEEEFVPAVETDIVSPEMQVALETFQVSENEDDFFAALEDSGEIQATTLETTQENVATEENFDDTIEQFLGDSTDEELSPISTEEILSDDEVLHAENQLDGTLVDVEDTMALESQFYGDEQVFEPTEGVDEEALANLEETGTWISGKIDAADDSEMFADDAVYNESEFDENVDLVDNFIVENSENDDFSQDDLFNDEIIDDIETVQEKPKKRGFWARLFGKK